MIVDKLNNLNLYKIIPNNIYEILQDLSKDLSSRRIALSGNSYINIDEYYTKHPDDAKFEAHKKFIDIQLLLRGTENIYYNAKDELNIDIPYDSEHDIEFYKEKAENYSKITLDGSNFVLFFPHEAHAPQVSVNNISNKVVKAVIKIKV